MNNFWTLVGFEYKKIFQRKSVPILIFLILLFTIFLTTTTIIGSDNVSTEGDIPLSNYELMKLCKEYDLALSGRPIDSTLIMEAVEAYQQVPTDVYPYTKSKEYLESAMPYSSIFTLIDSAFASRNTGWDISAMQNLTAEQADSYYEKRMDQYQLNLENNPMFSDANIERVLKNDSSVEKPIIFQVSSGYIRFLSTSSTTALCIMLFISFAFSSMFSGEYQARTDNLILTSKRGKSTLILVKVFTAISLGFILSIITFLTSYLFHMFIFGFEGTNAAIQNFIALITYDFTMFETVILLFVTTMFATFFMVSITLYISSVAKPIVTLSITTLIAFVGLFNGLNLPFVQETRYFLPTAMGNFTDVTTQLSFHVFGIDIWLYQAICIVAFFVGTLLLLLAYRNFKQHQVG